jgi:hypothetical protein
MMETGKPENTDMGITLNHAAFLLYVRMNSGVNFHRTIMFGRQSLFLNADDAPALFSRFGLRIDRAEAAAMIREGQGYSEPFLRRLGADVTDSLDASPYEGANIIHDLNEPVSASLHESYSAVIDGGTLEHVFNYPIAIQNCMNLVSLV